MTPIFAKPAAVSTVLFTVALATFMLEAAPVQILADADAGTAVSADERIADALLKLHAGETNQIVLADGNYQLNAPIRLGANLGQPAGALIFEAAPGSHPVLSGGREIGGWQKLGAGSEPGNAGLPAAAVDNVWVADVAKVGNRVPEFRQLWVNGTKAVRARNPNSGQLERLRGWDKTNRVAIIPTAALSGGTNPAGMEMVIDQVWEIAVLRIASISLEGTNARVTFREPEGQIEFQHPWPPVTVNAKYQAPFFLANAIQFLDAPGEWYEDVAAGKIYYWPQPGEDMARATVYAPVLETLVEIAGTTNQPAGNITFKGIAFEHTGWLRPSEEGHVPLQAGMYMLEAHKLKPRGTSYHPGLDNVAWIGRPPGAVRVENAADVTFEECRFEHLGSAGLDIGSGVHDGVVEGCVFRDIGGNGIQLGRFSDTNVETHLPYLPSDEREVCSGVKICNNVIRDCGNEDWGCVGIAAGYVREVRIEHNEVFDLPYTGISVGWGWTKATNCMGNNVIRANHVHQVAQRLGDTAGIYLLSAQPGTMVSENSVHDIKISPYVPDPEHWFYLYLDEGSSFITVRDNWCPAMKFLKNANGPGNVWDNNGPQVSDRIKSAAGLEPEYRGLLSN